MDALPRLVRVGDVDTGAEDVGGQLLGELRVPLHGEGRVVGKSPDVGHLQHSKHSEGLDNRVGIGQDAERGDDLLTEVLVERAPRALVRADVVKARAEVRQVHAHLHPRLEGAHFAKFLRPAERGFSQGRAEGARRVPGAAIL